MDRHRHLTRGESRRVECSRVRLTEVHRQDLGCTFGDEALIGLDERCGRRLGGRQHHAVADRVVERLGGQIETLAVFDSVDDDRHRNDRDVVRRGLFVGQLRSRVGDDADHGRSSTGWPSTRGVWRNRRAITALDIAAAIGKAIGARLSKPVDHPRLHAIVALATHTVDATAVPAHVRCVHRGRAAVPTATATSSGRYRGNVPSTWPILVATPLPPVRPVAGWQCATTAAVHARFAAFEPLMRLATTAAAAPLATSVANTAAPQPLPSDRAAFSAPGLCEPTVRRSESSAVREKRLAISAEGMFPSAYPAATPTSPCIPGVYAGHDRAPLSQVRQQLHLKPHVNGSIDPYTEPHQRSDPFPNVRRAVSVSLRLGTNVQ